MQTGIRQVGTGQGCGDSACRVYVEGVVDEQLLQGIQKLLVLFFRKDADNLILQIPKETFYY